MSDKQRLLTIVESLPPEQVRALLGNAPAPLDAFQRALRAAPPEELNEETAAELREALRDLDQHGTVSQEDVEIELGLR
ncbi:MAG: hypothetical protein SGI92_26515 [Bryobacteraceae bacterium]|nr:hypothetical protein [Bryobacteraceae bacterium]